MVVKKKVIDVETNDIEADIRDWLKEHKDHTIEVSPFIHYMLDIMKKNLEMSLANSDIDTKGVTVDYNMLIEYLVTREAFFNFYPNIVPSEAGAEFEDLVYSMKESEYAFNDLNEDEAKENDK